MICPKLEEILVRMDKPDEPMMEESHRGDYSRISTIPHINTVAAMAIARYFLRVQRQFTSLPQEVFTNMFSSTWWLPPTCGTAAAIIGLLYPCLDNKLGEPHTHRREWSSVMRCVAVFVGINHASAKIDFANNMQLSLTLAAMSIGLWWLFDRSRSGFGLGVGIAVLATFVTQLLVYNGVYKSWLPCVFFSGGVTMGNIGRQLAMYDHYEEQKEKAE
ncbi:Insulin-induced gene 1 protein,Insulin-induced gene 2 protein [Acanthosepion pharaonis]|uniref:Insulin-induced gene 1 protein,Insulin-induced gene 2 protein n=1 Tax=Acanthosepion pharaonis TaxID=158019 RepID=A0A812EXD2_ACAPH|nr:Insulin-induced gene 1 protein,Insulin-induced gene 2 protein [Sepia pharaonis]